MITRCIACEGDDVRVVQIIEDPNPEVNPAVVLTECANCRWRDETTVEDLALVAGDHSEVDFQDLPW